MKRNAAEGLIRKEKVSGIERPDSRLGKIEPEVWEVKIDTLTKKVR